MGYLTKASAHLLFAWVLLATSSAFAQSAVKGGQSSASCEELGTLAAYVKRCGGTPPRTHSATELSKDVADWAASFFECAKSQVTQFDDKISDAATVATGLSGYCRSKISASNGALSTQDSDAIVERMKPNVIAVVLQSRVSERRKTQR